MELTHISASKQMRWIGLVEIFNETLAGEWHSGSCTNHEAKSGCDTQEEAEKFCKTVEERYAKYTHTKYRISSCVLCYDEANSKNVEKFFRYL
jgi:hypothetical protein